MNNQITEIRYSNGLKNKSDGYVSNAWVTKDRQGLLVIKEVRIGDNCFLEKTRLKNGEYHKISQLKIEKDEKILSVGQVERKNYLLLKKKTNFYIIDLENYSKKEIVQNYIHKIENLQFFKINQTTYLKVRNNPETFLEIGEGNKICKMIQVKSEKDEKKNEFTNLISTNKNLISFKNDGTENFIIIYNDNLSRVKELNIKIQLEKIISSEIYDGIIYLTGIKNGKIKLETLDESIIDSLT